MNSKKVLAAMSGGLDSSVATALLIRAGFNVEGVFLKLGDLPSFKKSEKRAKKIAKILGIHLMVLDLRKEFKEKIIDYFLKSYRKNLTPNPCVICNKEIKFKFLIEQAQKLQADFIAAGHYAKKSEIKKNSKISYKLLKARDKEKDQSYFLWKLGQKELKHILFPIADYSKSEVKRIAGRFKILKEVKPPSQEICFIEKKLQDFLARHLGSAPGPVAEKYPSGVKKINIKHRGLWFYTIGQRKGIGLPGGPYYVLNKDLKKNLLVITRREKDLYKKELEAEDINWISGKTPKLPKKCWIKIRYRDKATLGKIIPLNSKKIKVIFSRPKRAITPGQSVVFYRGEEVLGGGIIQ
jgi:tRNA-specific 2-thiouridylase